MLLPVALLLGSHFLAAAAADGQRLEHAHSGTAAHGQPIQGRQLRQADLWSVPAEAAQAVGSQPCPARYDRMSVADVAAGAKPYVFGGDQQPICRACKSDNERAQYCRQVEDIVPSHHLCGFVIAFLSTNL